MQIGELFILRISIHLQGSVLDAPELMWAEPQLDPVYQAVRSYLEMDQRVGLLTEAPERHWRPAGGAQGPANRDARESLCWLAAQAAQAAQAANHQRPPRRRQGELLEWIVIILIFAEIVVAAINILVDLHAAR